jgi:hypothetical protein
MGNAYRILVGNMEGKKPLRDLDIGGRIILKFILKNYSVGVD